MSFALRKNNEVTYISNNSSTGGSSGGGSSTNYWSLTGNDISNNNSGDVYIRTSLVRIGTDAGLVGQSNGAIAIGNGAGSNFQTCNAIAIGNSAAFNNQGNDCVAIGSAAGAVLQKGLSIAIGSGSGNDNQGSGAIAIGYQSGFRTQGSNAIAIGAFAACTNQLANSIVIDASASQISQSILTNNTGFYVRPVRSDVSEAKQALVYDPNSFEITRVIGKTFVIPHPNDNNKYLVHACLEGPETGVYYRGKAIINENEDSIEIVLPNYVENFAKNFTVHVTSHSPNVSLFSNEVDQGRFVVQKHAFCSQHKEQVKFSWYVMGERGSIDVEPLKKDVTVVGDGPYKYIL